MATNMAPHNLNEVLDASLLLLEKEGKPLKVSAKAKAPKATDPGLELIAPEDIKTTYEVSVDEIMEIIKGPDFPTGGFIYDSTNIKEVYRKGK
jgi:DNA gyrase subunit A